MKASNIKICVIGTRGFPDYIGGIETVCKNLYTEAVKLEPRLQVSVLTRHAQDIVKNTDLGTQIDVKTMPTIRIPGLENALSTFLSIAYALVFIRPHVIHLHGIGPGFFTLVAKITGKKVVVTDHAPDYERPKWGKFGKWFLKTGEKHAVKYADKTICVSHVLRKELEALYPNYSTNIITIRNGGNLTFERESSLTQQYPKHSYYLYVGRLEETKAVDDLMKAFAMINSDKKLLIVGEELDGHQYTDYLQTLLTPNIIFTGAIYGDELTGLYKNALALVHPSNMEGYCLVVAEAISVNTPVILSDVPPHREFKLPEASFFEVSNIQQLSQKLSYSNTAEFLTQEAVDYQHANTWVLNAQLHLQLYKELCEL